VPSCCVAWSRNPQERNLPKNLCAEHECHKNAYECHEFAPPNNSISSEHKFIEDP